MGKLTVWSPAESILERVLEELEKEARAAKKCLWIDPQTLPPSTVGVLP